MHDILDEIIMHREEDYQRLGPTFGTFVPRHRMRPLVPFLAEPGVVLEIKRASPSRGSIAMDLDPVTMLRRYESAGARNVSVLTEQHYFKGSLEDLMEVGIATYQSALLRKDFIRHEDEIEVSYRAGADAVLLIARILETSQLRSLATLCRHFGMTALVEIRGRKDLEKLAMLLEDGPVVAGVNSRDLSTFRIDPLVPAAFRDLIPCKAIFESGAMHPGMCTYARRLGYEGILIGESVARHPETAGQFVDSFASAKPDRVGEFWKTMGQRVMGKQTKPLVKICGLTRQEDALHAASLGADVLGFVFASSSPRCATPEMVRQVSKLMAQQSPLLVAVVTETTSNEAIQAFELAQQGVIDAIQYHGSTVQTDLAFLDTFSVGRYGAIGLETEKDLEQCNTLLASGEPRVLLDAKIAGKSGGTGHTIADPLVQRMKEHVPLWLAGGIGADTVRSIIDQYEPELIDVSSKLESSLAHKDHQLMEKLFQEITS